MVVRPEAVAERIAGLRAALTHLSSLRGSDPYDLTSEWAVERGLQVAAQAVFDIGNHVLSGAFGDRPAEYADVLPALCRRAVITAELEQRLRGLAGFRNLLVHDYARVEPRRVHELMADRLGDLLDFADALDSWLTRNG